MGPCVLDASAVLASVFEEQGAAEVDARLEDASISAVNLSEVVATLADRGTPAEIIALTLASLKLDVHSFDREQAERAGLLRPETRRHGLSFGDRACLALAATLDRPALTADREWKRLKIGIAIEVVR
jgi:ribonuclease VapC